MPSPVVQQALDHRKAVRLIPLPELITRYVSGETTSQLASEAQVDRATMYRWMLSGIGDEQYHDVVTHCLTNRIADADHRLSTAREMCDIVRAREMAKFSRMDLERRRPALYGMRHAMSVDNQITVTVQRNPLRSQNALRTPRARQKAVDITSQVRPSPTGSEDVSAQSAVRTSQISVKPKRKKT